MRISFSWLKEYIDLPEPAEEVAEVLTATGLEVEKTEETEAVPGGLKGLVIGEVLTCSKHPNADKLSVTTVDIGEDEPSPIVCGAPNVKAGQKVVVATVNTMLYPSGHEPFKIKKAKIRGEESRGMICAEDEIGLGTSHDGIMVLDTDLPNGTAASDYFNLENDFAFEIGLTPNRGDATSHIGVARDLKAYHEREINWPDVSGFQTGNHKTIAVKVENSEACPRYSGVTITDIKVEESPEWLKKRLLSIGLNPINNVVDITNFVLHETGQPLHAFDADEITGDEIIVKTVASGTVFKTLDEVDRKLTDLDLMICNAEDGMCIAGVFGGIKSGVKESTTSIFLESAYFSPDFIRRTAQHHGLKTDASFRFERGTDPEMTLYAMKRAALMIADIAGGKVSSDIVDIYPNKISPLKIEVSYSNIDRLIGISIERDIIHGILNRLDIETQQIDEKGFTAIVPAYRMDVTREADIIEEILRIYGFNKIPLPETIGADYLAEFPEIDSDNLQKIVSDILTGSGFYEIMSNSLTKPAYSEMDPSLEPSENVEILNRLSEDLGVMRQSILFGLLEAASYNISHRQRNLKLFEFGNTYRKKDKYKESRRCGILLTGEIRPQNWNIDGGSATFYDLSSVVSKIIKRISSKVVETEVIESSYLQYGLQFKIDNKVVATAGLVSPSIAKKLDIKQEVYFADIDWVSLVKKATSRLEYREVPKFPEVKRDLSLVLQKKISFNEVKTVAAKNSNHLLKRVTVFDVYEGEKIGADEKAYALSFVLQDDTKTLTDKIIDKTMTKLMVAFENELGANIRK